GNRNRAPNVLKVDILSPAAQIDRALNVRNPYVSIAPFRLDARAPWHGNLHRSRNQPQRPTGTTHTYDHTVGIASNLERCYLIQVIGAALVEGADGFVAGHLHCG